MAEEFVIEKAAARMLARGLAGLVVLAMLAYPVDWAIWRARVAAGGGMGSFSVNLYTVAELKGNKEDYYANGTAMVSCSRSLYPQGGYNPCWWVQRHREVFEKY